MNGIEAVRHIRQTEKEEERKTIPIIAVTANALSSDKARFLDAGMDDYIAKPYTEKVYTRYWLNTCDNFMTDIRLDLYRL